MINKLVVENLKHRPVRTLLSVVAIGMEVTMMLTLVGMSRGMVEEAARRARGVGADIWVRPPGSSVIGFSSAPMPEKLLAFFSKQPHVVLATGTVTQPLRGIESVTGIDLGPFTSLSGGFRYVAGGPFQGPDDLIIDDRYAEQNKLQPGSSVMIWTRKWRVCGIVEAGKLARLMVPLKVLQDLTSNTGKLTQIFLKVDNPKNTDAVIASLKKEMPDYQIYSIEEFTSLFTVANVPMLKEFIGVVVGVSVIVGFLVVFLSMYTAVLERTREIGILKSLGATPGYVLGLLVRETALLALAGSVFGILLSYVTCWLVFKLTPLTQHIVPDWWPIAGGIAVGGALLGTLYPGWKAVRQDALEALSYE